MRKNGFTLSEIIIIGFCLILITQIGYRNFVKGEKESRDMKRRADMEELQRTLDHFYQVYWQYPKEVYFGQKLMTPDGGFFVHKNASGIAEDMPTDPLNKAPYLYTYKSKDKENLTYQVCAKKQELNSLPFCFSDDKREQFKEDVQQLKKLYENE